MNTLFVFHLKKGINEKESEIVMLSSQALGSRTLAQFCNENRSISENRTKIQKNT
jgi:hypothetical protein